LFHCYKHWGLLLQILSQILSVYTYSCSDKLLRFYSFWSSIEVALHMKKEKLDEFMLVKDEDDETLLALKTDDHKALAAVALRHINLVPCVI